MNWLEDRSGDTLQTTIVWACVLGAFYLGWTYVKPKFIGTIKNQGDVLESSGSE